jgi:hypothetical protein
MFRKMAIALVAASVFTAPVLAQNTLSGGATPSTPSPSTDTMDKAKPEKTEKSAESVEKTEKKVTKHHKIARHHRHGAKAAKLGKAHVGATTAMGKQPTGKTEKLTKTERRKLKHAFGKAPKHMPSEKAHPEKAH